jgi:hypothetical protein
VRNRNRLGMSAPQAALTIEIVGNCRLSTNMFALPLQESLATVSAAVV